MVQPCSSSPYMPQDWALRWSKWCWCLRWSNPALLPLTCHRIEGRDGVVTERLDAQKPWTTSLWPLCTKMLKVSSIRRHSCSTSYMRKINCCIEETHLQPNKFFKVSGYQCFRSHTTDQSKGRVLTLVTSNINACLIHTHTYINVPPQDPNRRTTLPTLQHCCSSLYTLILSSSPTPDLHNDYTTNSLTAKWCSPTEVPPGWCSAGLSASTQSTLSN